MAERFPTAIPEHGEIKMGHTQTNAGPYLYCKGDFLVNVCARISLINEGKW
jgi:hypothetical protein